MKKFHFHLMEKSPKESSCNISRNAHCGKVITDEYAGELICSKCGVVLEEKTISYRQEPTKNDSGEMSSQMMITNTKYIGVSTSIGNQKSFGIKDYAGKTIPKITQDSLNRLYNSGNIQRTSCQKSQKSIISGMIKLDGLVHRLHLSENVCQETVTLYKRAHAAKIVSGRSVMGVMAACLYYSCKKLGIPRNMAEICGAANIKKNVLFSCYKVMVDSMGLYCSKKNYDDNNNNGNSHVNNGYTITKQRHIRCIPKIISKLNLHQRISRKSASLILLQDDYLLSGKNPNVVVATAIYLTCNHDKKYNSITQREISEASGITTMSIRNLSKKIIMME